MPLIKVYNIDSDLYRLKGHSIFKSVHNSEALWRASFGHRTRAASAETASSFKTFGVTKHSPNTFLAKDWTQQWIHAWTQDMRFIPRFGHTTKVSYSLLRSPKRVESFSTLILHKPTTKIKANSFIKLAQESEWYKLLRVIHNLGDSKATSICRGTRRFQEQQVRTRGVCKKKAQEMRRRGERKTKSEGHEHKPHTKGSSIKWFRSDLGCVCVRVCVSFVSS
jgi:hypothetical protein